MKPEALSRGHQRHTDYFPATEGFPSVARGSPIIVLCVDYGLIVTMDSVSGLLMTALGSEHVTLTKHMKDSSIRPRTMTSSSFSKGALSGTKHEL